MDYSRYGTLAITRRGPGDAVLDTAEVAKPNFGVDDAMISDFRDMLKTTRIKLDEAAGPGAVLSAAVRVGEALISRRAPSKGCCGHAAFARGESVSYRRSDLPAIDSLSCLSISQAGDLMP